MIGIEIIIVILLLVILFIVLTGHIYIIKQPVSPRVSKPVSKSETKPIVKPNKKIGGCEGTRYGCCPYSEIPKLNEIGSNCQYQN
jgi:hypothetical protein